MLKSERSVSEIQMMELLVECEELLLNGILTYRHGKQIIEAGYKLLAKCEELRKSRDNLRRKKDIKKRLLCSVCQGKQDALPGREK